MIVIGLFVGLVNGLLTTLLKVPSFIVTLGMMLALLGLALWWTGGAATGTPPTVPPDRPRRHPRHPVHRLPAWSVLILAAWLALGILITKRPLGKLLIAIGDNARRRATPVPRDWWVTTRAFMISALSATVSAVLLVGYAGVHPSVGRGYEFIAITAVVLGGVVLGGGRGWIVAAVAGAFVLEALFLLLNIAGVAVDDARRGAGRHHHRRRRLLRPRVPLPPPRRAPHHFSRPGEETRRARGRRGVRITCPRCGGRR